MIKLSRPVFIFLLVIIILPNSLAQNKDQGLSRHKISCPEKWWAIGHIFIAKKAFRITTEALVVTDSLSQTQLLGNDLQGGMLDAFKHAYWMASLSQHIKWRKAHRLGIAHEKGNYKSYKKGKRKAASNLPDKISSDMELWNNDAGLKIGRENHSASKPELQQIIIDALHKGQMKIIYKDRMGNFLNCQGHIIPIDSLQGKWENNKCLVPSGNSIN
jgi:hypothetical protein